MDGKEMNNSVVFWFDHPPKVEVGAFNAFGRLWEGDVLYVISNPHRSERVLANWSEEYGRARVVCLYEETDRKLRIQRIIQENPDAIHILNGFDTNICKEIKPFLFHDGLKALLFSERPAIMGNWGEKILRKIHSRIKYSKLCREYSKYVQAILPMGEKGVRAFENLGFPGNRIYDFMYCPPLKDLSHLKEVAYHNPIRFVYVGRFYYKTKGTDVLLEALPLLKGAWTLDLAGGYGADKDDVLARISGYNNVRFVGTWESDSVVKNLQDYDVVVIPSTADGWNLLVNEAIHAGLGVIVSDQAVSHEVVSNHGGGCVFKSGSSKHLAEAMQQVIDEPGITLEWMEQAKKNVPLVSMESVGVYLYQIVCHEFYNVGGQPVCPWR